MYQLLNCVEGCRCCACSSSLAAYLVVGLDVQLDLFAGEGADSEGGLVSLCAFCLEGW